MASLTAPRTSTATIKQGPATKRCGECRLGLGVHTPTDPYCDHYQTPTAERAAQPDRPSSTRGHTTCATGTSGRRT